MSKIDSIHIDDGGQVLSQDMARITHDCLVAGPLRGDAFDRHILACLIAVARAEAATTGTPLNHGLGLTTAETAAMMDRVFPHAVGLRGLLDPEGGAGDEAIEEEDLRDLLLDHRTRGQETEAWLAAMVARRSLRPNHLWQDLGLGNRGELSRLLERHFAPLAVRNTRNMKWKKFFYRELCQREGIVVCKSPHCEACEDHAICFGPEEGLALLAG